MWFIVDDQMADDRRIRRLPLATVGLWVKLCVIHSKGVSMQVEGPGRRIPATSTSSTSRTPGAPCASSSSSSMRDSWRSTTADGVPSTPKASAGSHKMLTEEQREARRKAGSKGGRRKAANQKAKQTSGDLPENSQANGEQNSSETGSETSSKLLGDSQAKTWHKTDTDTDIPSPTPPAGKPKQPATPESGFDRFAETYPGSVGAKGRKTEIEAQSPVRGHRRKPRRTDPTPDRAPPLQARRQRRPNPQRPHPTTQHMAPRPMGDMGAGTHHTRTPAQAHLELRTRPPAHGST